MILVFIDCLYVHPHHCGFAWLYFLTSLPTPCLWSLNLMGYAILWIIVSYLYTRVTCHIAGIIMPISYVQHAAQ